MAWRDAPLLVALNALAVLGLLTLLAANYRGVSLARLPGAHALAQLFVAPLEIAVRPGPLVVHSTGQVQIDRERARRLVPVGRGLALATPVVLCFTALLMAADSVFASYVMQVVTITLPFDISTLIGHGALTLAVAWICAGGLLVALASDTRSSFGEAIERLCSGLMGLVHVAPDSLPAEGATQRLATPRRAPLSLGWVEALTVLVAVDALFGGFMAIQGAYFFGGLDTLDRTGMTYADYARRGFFELLTVACLALGMLCALAVVTRRESRAQRRGFNIASGALIALVLGLLASAFQRMLLYEQAYGYTQLRLYTHSFMIWLALVLGLFLLALLRAQPRLFVLGGFASALIYLATLNIANPDAMIVRENIARYQASGKLDAFYLAGLSADAAPTLAAALPSIDEASRAIVERGLAYQRDAISQAMATQGWPSWTVARVRVVGLEPLDDSARR